ncbi:MAG TPA: hypothetical protein VIH24_00265, partial [Candidatus Limnocylindria bacterium]
SGVADEDALTHLHGLVRREMLTVEANPRSPERGQYGFVQALVREVAYGTLAKRDRRRLHLAAARYFETLDDEGIAGALAEHYVAAYKAQPDGPEGEAVAAQARVALRGAAERARSLGSFTQALRFLERALEVTTDPAEEYALQAAAGDAGLYAGLSDEPIAHTTRALELARRFGDRERIMLATVSHALAISTTGQIADNAALLEPARIEFRDLEATLGYVRLCAELARSYLLLSRGADAIRVVDETLPVAERLELTREIIELVVTRGAALAGLGRPSEGTIILRGAVSAASAAGLPDVELRGRVNLSYAAAADDPELAYRVAREGLVLADRLGMRGYAYYLIGNAVELAIRMGDWDWAVAAAEGAAGASGLDLAARLRRAEFQGLRGHDVSTELQALTDELADVTEVQAQSITAETWAMVKLAQGDHRAALDLAQGVYRVNLAPDGTSPWTAIRAAAALGDPDAVTDALRAIEEIPGRVLSAVRREGEATLAGLAGRRQEALHGFLDAVRRWQELGLAVEAAFAQLNLVTVLGASDPEAAAAGEAARALFQRLDAQPLLDRLAEAQAAGGVGGAASGGGSPLVAVPSENP